MKISLIAAMSRSGVIGKNNQMPWHLPADLKYFKSVTMGKPIVMGRKTFESLGKPLPGRLNIVLSRNTNYTAECCTVIHHVDELTSEIDADEIMIIGGADIFAVFLPLANNMYLTEVGCEVEGDTFFPEFKDSDWKIELILTQHADEKNPCDLRFMRYDRRS